MCSDDYDCVYLSGCVGWKLSSMMDGWMDGLDGVG